MYAFTIPIYTCTSPRSPSPPPPSQDLCGNAEISWNHVEFEVRYESLSEEIKIGDYYLRLLLDEGGSTKFVKP